MKLDLDRVRVAMARKSSEGASERARRVYAEPATVLRWLEGKTTPSGDNLAKLASVLDVSIPWMMGAKEIGQREGLIRAMRQHLAVGKETPEADIVEAMGSLSDQQRCTLRDAVIGLLPTVRGIAHLRDRQSSEPVKAADSETAQPVKHRRTRR